MFPLLQAKSFAEVLRHWATKDNSQVDPTQATVDNPAIESSFRTGFAFRYLNGKNEESITYNALDESARKIAATLLVTANRGDRTLLMFEPGLEFIQSFMACIYAGITAVPISAPNPAQRETVTRFNSIVENSKATLLLTTNSLIDSLQTALDSNVQQGPSWLGFESCFQTDIMPPHEIATVEDNVIALLQYTSGSTRAPKGVLVSHENLMHNARLIRTGMRQDTMSPIGVHWLPSYHDMGLMGGILQTIFLGGSSILLSPSGFIRRPLAWLKAISQYKATTCGGPNFAFEHCTRRIPDSALKDLDLSSWQIAFCGAEPIKAETLDAFAKKFSKAGFNKNAFTPCYGMAEGTLAVTIGTYADEDVITLKGEAFERKKIERAAPDTIGSTRFVSSGPVVSDQRLEIVDPETCLTLADSEIGEIWVAGKSIAQGYLGEDAETQSAFSGYLKGGDGPFLKTGDLGFMRNGRLFVTGRAKEMIVINGRNLYPQDIEACIAQAHPAISLGSIAAVSVPNGATEALGLAVEAKANQVEEFKHAIHLALAGHFGLTAAKIAFVKKRSLPLTSSGKLQRTLVQQRLLEGKFTEVTDTPSSASLYKANTPEFEKLEARDTKYRFDIEADVAWNAADASNQFFSDALLAVGGIDLRAMSGISGASDEFQWALAIALCEEFVVLEQRIVGFLSEERANGRLPASRSVDLFDEEEVKHIQLFRRVADTLKMQKPHIAGALDKHIEASLTTAWWHQDKVENYPSPEIYHYVCWLHFLYFEEYSIYLYTQLKNGSNINPLWLSANYAHMREETQHVRTDAGYLDLLNLDEETRATWGRWFIEQSAKDASGLAGLEGVWTFLVERYPTLQDLPLPASLLDNINLKQAAFLRLLDQKNAFLRTKRGARFDHYADALFKTDVTSASASASTNKLDCKTETEVSGTVETVQALIISSIASQLDMAPERVDPAQHFLLFGLDSVSALSISADLENALNIKLSPTLLFEQENIAGMARAITQLVIEQSGADPTHRANKNHAQPNDLPEETVNLKSLEQDCIPSTLDMSIFDTPNTGAEKRCFITGATGFLCAFVLHEQLQSDSNDVLCLVRAGSEEEGRNRIKRNLQQYGIWHASYADRIQIVLGNLEQKLFGLTENAFTDLANKVSQIIHGGAKVDFIQPYEQLHSANVLGTQEVIRLAFTAGQIPLELVSTIGIFDTNNQRGIKEVSENCTPDSNAGFRNGYAQSKWEAEKLALLAQSKGLPVRIYRPGVVSGNTENGAWQPDMVAALLKTYIEYGIAIQSKADGNLNAAPVDYVAKAIVNISQTRDGYGQVYHLTNPQPTLWTDIIKALRDMDHPIDVLPYEQWVAQLSEVSDTEVAILPYLAYFKTRSERWQLRQPPISTKNTRNALRNTEIVCDQINSALLRKYINYFRQCGFINTNTRSDLHEPSA